MNRNIIIFIKEHSIYQNPEPPFAFNAANASGWDRWLMVLNLYFVAESIIDLKIREAKLLFHGGKDVQDVYYSEPSIDKLLDLVDVFDKTVNNSAKD